MKAIILAGGIGSRLSEETVLKPKPMVEIGGRPILWHIMSIFAAHEVGEFVLALGYKAEAIKDYFLNFYALNHDISVDLGSGRTTIHDGDRTDWKVHLVDLSGLSSGFLTGRNGRASDVDRDDDEALGCHDERIIEHGRGRASEPRPRFAWVADEQPVGETKASHLGAAPSAGGRR